MRILWLILICMISFGSYADVVVRGFVYDSEKHPLGGVMIRLHSNGKPKAFTTSASDGSFRLHAEKIGDSAFLKFLSQKFDQLNFPLDSIPETIRVYLQPKDFVLQEVVVRAPERRIKGDTIHYDVSALAKTGDRTIEDVIKKIPGMQVDDNGGISYDGRPLKHFYIEDIDLMGKNYAIASQSINPDDISTISVYERHQDKRVLQGKEESENASINLKLKKGRMLKPIGYLQGGAGAGDKFLWNGELYGMLISPRMQTIISAKGDNNGYTFGSRKSRSRHSIFSPVPFGEPSIKPDRFLDNRSALASANSLFKLGKDLTFKINSSYTRNEENFQGRSVTEYLNPDEENIYYSEKADNRLRYQTVNLSANVESNCRNLFFSDIFEFQGDFSRNSYDAAATGGVMQRLNSDNYYFSNKLNTIINSKGKLYQIESETSFIKSPPASMSARDLATGESVVNQEVSANSFHNREQTSLSWYFNNGLATGTALSFEIHHDKFSSTGAVAGRDNSINDLSGHRIVTSAEPFLKFNLLKSTWRLTVPVRLYNIKFNNLLKGETYTTDKVLPDIKLSVSRKFNRMNQITLSIGSENTVGDIRDFIDNPIHTTFRNTRTLGSGTLKRVRADFIKAGYSCRDIMKNFHLLSAISYRKTDRNTLSVSNVSNSGTSGSLSNTRNKGEIATILLNATKGVRKINTSFGIDLNMTVNTSRSIRSSTVITTKSKLFFISADIRTYQFSDVLMIAATASYMAQRQTFGGMLAPNKMGSVSCKGKIGVYPVRKLEIYCTVDMQKIRSDQISHKTNLFIDAGAIYTIKKFDFSLNARNLTNLREYSQTLYNSLDISYRSYGLRPLEAVFSVKYRF